MSKQAQLQSALATMEIAASMGRKAEVTASAPRTAYYEDVESVPDPDAYDERWLTASERRSIAPAAGEEAPASNVGRVYREGAGMTDTARAQRVWHGL